jgi:glutaredoxin 3
MLMQYLKSKGVEFTSKDITIDREALDFVANNVGQLATPVTDIDGTIILGFDRPRIDAALDARK